MSKGVQPSASLRIQLDSSKTTVLREDSVEIVVVGKRLERCLEAKEDFAIVAGGTSVTKIIDKGRSQFVCYGQFEISASLALSH